MKKFSRLMTILLAMVLILTLATACAKDEVETEQPQTEQKEEPKQQEEAVEPVVLKLAWAETADPESHPVSGAVNLFKQELEEKSGGRIVVELYPAGQLGDQKSTLQQVEQGLIQSSLCSTGMIAGAYDDNYNVFEMPYLFPTADLAWEIVQPGKEFANEFFDAAGDRTGIRPLAILVEGLRHTTNSVKEIRSPEDFEGLKIRTMEVPAHMEIFKALGANPTPIAWAEVYTALQTGVVDGQENPLFNIEYAKFYEVQDYLTLDGHITLLNCWFINQDFYDSLGTELQGIVDECALTAAQKHREMVIAKDEAAMAILVEKGMQVYTPTKDEYEQFKSITQEALKSYIEGNMTDTSWIDKLQSLIDAAN